MKKETKEAVLEAIAKRIGSPKSYTMDGESITMDTPEDLARLIQMVEQLDKEEGRTGRTPFRIAVCNNNSPII